MQKFLVTGGAGFIGSHVVDELVRRGFVVTVLDDLSSGKEQNLEWAMQAGQVDFVRGSILDSVALNHAISEQDCVIHMAVECVRRSIRSPVRNHEVNASGTLKVLEAANRAKVEKFVYCSSSEVYGNAAGDTMSETTTVPAPTTVYGAAKLAGEHYAQAYLRTYGLQTSVVRPFNAYGPREHEEGDLAEVIPRFLIRLLNRKPPVIFGDGNQARDFTFVTDTARGIVLAALCKQTVGKVINIGFGSCTSVKELAVMMSQKISCSKIEPEFEAVRPGDVMRLHAEISLAQELLGFKPLVSLSEGLDEYISWFKSRHPNPASLLEAQIRNW